jgi:hypothetical protein
MADSCTPKALLKLIAIHSTPVCFRIDQKRDSEQKNIATRNRSKDHAIAAKQAPSLRGQQIDNIPGRAAAKKTAQKRERNKLKVEKEKE